MYKNYIIGIFLSFLFLINQNAFAQVEPCATNIKHQEMLASDANYRATYQQMQADLQRYIAEKEANSANQRTEATVYTIPVVVHVIHTGGAVGTIYNPTVANINAMLGKINTDYRNAAFGADVEIEFVLAKRDPNCGATTGINRVDGSGLANYVAGGVGTGGATDAAVKALSIWSNTDYYNIWVVNKIDGKDGTIGSFTAGYAYFPGASAAIDGTVILATQTNGTSTTMTHEFGHAFALQHTFHKAEVNDDSATAVDCPLNTDCTTQGDLICDTDPHAYMLGGACNTSNCGGVSQATLDNYMSYCNNTTRFTPNQVTRMRTALETQRGGLITSLGGTAPITAPTTACTPTNTGNHSAKGVTRFVLNNLNVSSQSSLFEGTNYVNRVCGQGTTLIAGSSHTMTVETSINVHNVKVYVDYNNDGDFVDVGEEIASSPATTNVAGVQTFTTTYNVPNSGVLFNQPLRLRVVASTNSNGVATSCEVFQGQAEDYALTIQSVAIPSVNLSVSSNAGTEAAATAITVTATSSSAVVGNQTVNLAVTGTGITAGDYSLSGTSITILNGQTTGTVTFTVVDDALVEVTETATLTISSPSAGIILGATTTQDIAITDNDNFPSVNLSVSLNTGTEAAATAVTVTATSSSAVVGNQTVNLAVTGTGITGGDYSLSGTSITILNGQTTGTVTFTVVDDALVEVTETATLTISSPSAGIILGATTTQDIAITDNDNFPSVNLSVSSNTGTEAAATAVTVTATSSSAVVGNQTVNIAVTGTGITGGDYSLSGTSITILNGQTVGTVTFTVVDDALVEVTETATLTISSPSAGIILGATTTQDIAITDNDVATGNITNLNLGTFYTTIQAAVNAANNGDVLKILVNDFYDEDVNITSKALTFTSNATNFTQITIKSLVFNSAGKTLTISTHMGISKFVHMQDGDIIITGGNDFVLLSSSAGTAMVINDDPDPAKTIQGNVIMERYLNPVDDLGGTNGLGYHFFSSPFADAQISQFADDMNLVLNTAYNSAIEPTYVTPFPTFYLYDETSAGTATPSGIFNEFTIGFKVPTTVTLEVGRGYDANISTGGTVDLNGTLNNGDLLVPITNQGLGYAKEGFNLIGNPYPSPISWTDLINLGSNNTVINDALYVNIPTSQYGTTYASLVNNFSVNGGKADIAPFQGFFVHAQTAGNLDMTNSIRPNVYQDSRFYRTDENQDEKGAKEGAIKLAIEQNGKIDETGIYFERGATNKFDGKFDALKINKINSTTPTLYSYNEGIEENGLNTYFSINGLAEFNEDMILPLAMSIVKSGKHKIIVREIKYFHSLSNVYLYDSLTETLHDLKANPEYEFVSPVGKEIKRFAILFKTNKTFTQKDYIVAYPNPTPTNFSYSLKNDREGVHTIRVFDATGKLILERTEDKQGAFLEGTINLEKQASGLYLLQISDSKQTTNVRIIKE